MRRLAADARVYVALEAAPTSRGEHRGEAGRGAVDPAGADRASSAAPTTTVNEYPWQVALVYDAHVAIIPPDNDFQPAILRRHG